MDATEFERREMAETRPRPPDERARDERARAVAYLDLWERHVSQTALHGPAPWPMPARSGA